MRPWLLLILSSSCDEPAGSTTDEFWQSTYRLTGTFESVGPTIRGEPPVASLRVFPDGPSTGTFRLLGPEVDATVPYRVEGEALVATAGFNASSGSTPCSSGSMSFQGFTVTAVDTDLDGTLDAVHAAATANVSWVSGDVGGSGEASARWTGQVDGDVHATPSFSGRSLHPLDRPSYVVDSPVEADALDLTSADGSTVVREAAFVSEAGHTPGTHFSLVGPPLPFGASLAVGTEGLLDERGISIPAATFRVIGAPRLFDTPDFEGTVHAHLDGALLEPPPFAFLAGHYEGEQTLWLGTYARATFRLDGTSRTTLAITVRVPSSYLDTDVDGELLRLAFFDESGVDEVVVTTPPLTFASAAVASDPVTVHVPLPARARDAVFGLALQRGRFNPYACGPVVVGLVVDTLALE